MWHGAEADEQQDHGKNQVPRFEEEVPRSRQEWPSGGGLPVTGGG